MTNDMTPLRPFERDLLPMLAETAKEIHPASQRPNLRVSRSRRAIGGLVIGTALLSGSAIAAAIKMSAPDPKQAAQVEDESSSAARMHGEGWRPELAAEQVVCLIPEEDDLVSFASDFPLEQRLTSKKLARTCTEDASYVSGDEPASLDSVFVCISDERAPIAVVGFGEADCASTVVTDESDGRKVELRAITPADLDELNFMRALEVDVLAVPAEDGCPTPEEAAEWAQARLDESGIDELEIRYSDEGEGCYRGHVRWDTAFNFDGGGEVWIAKFGDQP